MSYDPKNYVNDALRTENKDTKDIRTRLDTDMNLRLIHGAMGLCTEAGEVMTLVKKYVYYGKSPNKESLIDEVGDVLWYVALLCDVLKVDLSEIMGYNINKLRKRYPEKFDNVSAIEQKDKQGQ